MIANAGLYQRVSDGTDKSVEEQNAANEAAAVTFGWRTVSFGDKVSASRFSRKPRPGWSALVAEVAAGKLDYVILWESSRGDRKLATWAGFLDACRETGTGIYITSHGRQYDVRNGRDWRTLAEDGVDSAYESEKTSLRVLRDVADTASRGDPYGRIPYGYKRSYERLPGRNRPKPIQHLDEKESPVVREIIGRIAKGEAISAIVRDLAEQGVTTRAGAPWSRSSVTRLVTDGVVYISKRRHNGSPLQDGNWPAIVDVDVYWKAVAVLADPARKAQADRRGGIRPGRARWLLSYVATCDVCRGPLSVKHLPRAGSKQKPPFYRCVVKGCVSAEVEWMDTLATAAVVRWCANPAAYEAITGSDDREALAAQDEAEVERQRLAGYEADAIAGKISAASFARIAAGIEARISELEARATELSVPPALRDLLAAPGSQANREQDIYERWLGMPVAAKRKVIAALGAPVLRPVAADQERFSMRLKVRGA
jgi:site-specific DNA recombinase